MSKGEWWVNEAMQRKAREMIEYDGSEIRIVIAGTGETFNGITLVIKDHKDDDAEPTICS